MLKLNQKCGQSWKKQRKLQQEFLGFVSEDAMAFDALMAAFKLPQEKPEEQLKRAEAIQEATIHAAEIPLEVCKRAIQVMQLALKAASIGNINAISDAASGFGMARAALTGAGWNVLINLKGLTGSGVIEFDADRIG